MEDLRKYRQCIVKESALYMVENNAVLKPKRKDLLQAAHDVVDTSTTTKDDKKRK